MAAVLEFTWEKVEIKDIKTQLVSYQHGALRCDRDLVWVLEEGLERK